MTDHVGMRCEQCREALSARLDGEDTPDERAESEAHLTECVDCQGWWDAAADITRLVRTSPVEPTPAVPDTVLAAAPGPLRARLAAGMRVLLGVLGSLQLALGVVQVTGSTTVTAYLHAGHPDSAGHLWHESAAWNIAVGTAFLWIASRHGRPIGAVPILTAFVGMLVLLSASDVIAGRVDTARLLSHGFVLTGYLVILALTRPAFDFGQPPTGPDHRTWRWRVHFDTDDQPTPVRRSGSRPVEGTARHAA
jgi:predicted anti-sigma-YlaC factor YlaD